MNAETIAKTALEALMLYVLPHAPEAFKPFQLFWDAKGYGPLPPSLAPWAEEDARVDAALGRPRG